jgi:hypothetical protein
MSKPIKKLEDQVVKYIGEVVAVVAALQSNKNQGRPLGCLQQALIESSRRLVKAADLHKENRNE